MEKNFSVEIKLSELGEKLGLRLVGDGTRTIRGAASPEEGTANTICAVWDEKTLNQIGPDVPILAKPEFFGENRPGLASIDPRGTLPALLNFFARPVPVLKGIHGSAAVSPEAAFSPEAWIGPFCVVEPGVVVEPGARLLANVYAGAGVYVGAGTVAEPGAVLMAGTSVGKNCILHAGCVIGCDGFGFLPSPAGIVKIPQIGNVTIGDDVEVGVCTAIDRGTIGDTVIGDGTKIDNHVQIGHNVKIGRHCIICSMTGIAGSSVIEDGVTVSVQVGITDHVRIGKGAVLAGRAGATNDIPPGAVVSGFPARPHREARRAQVLYTRLPELYERIKRLERAGGPVSSDRENKSDKSDKGEDGK